MTKQEKIKEAWVNQVGDKRYNALKEELVLDGFLFYQPSDLIQVDTKIIDGLPFYRPKSLKGIENNNGWSVIPSIHDKEIEKGQYWVMYPNGFIEVAYYDGAIECYKFWKLNFTYYQPIEKPKPPIY